MKRPLYIAAAIVVVLLAVGTFWLLSQRQAAPAPVGTTGSLPPTGTQQTGGTGGTGVGVGVGSSTGGAVAGSGGAPGTVKSFGIISNDPALNYFVDAQSNVTMVQPNGAIEQVSNGQSASLSSAQINDIIHVAFSYDGKKVLINFGDPINPQTSIFDIASKSWIPLPQGFQSPEWAPSDYRVAYLSSASSTGVSSVVVFDASSTKKTPSTLLTLNAPDLSLRWLNKAQLVLSDKPSVYSVGSALLFDLVQKTLSPLVAEKSGVESVWGVASTGTAPLGLVFTSNDTARGGTLRLNDLSGNVIQNLKFSTLPTKCVFASEMIAATSTSVLFCAVPRDQSGFLFSRLPDDYNQMALFTSDDIYRIVTRTGAMDATWSDQGQNLDVSNVKFFNNTLFFVNRYNQKLYGMVLN